MYPGCRYFLSDKGILLHAFCTSRETRARATNKKQHENGGLEKDIRLARYCSSKPFVCNSGNRVLPSEELSLEEVIRWRIVTATVSCGSLWVWEWVPLWVCYTPRVRAMRPGK